MFLIVLLGFVGLFNLYAGLAYPEAVVAGYNVAVGLIFSFIAIWKLLDWLENWYDKREATKSDKE